MGVICDWLDVTYSPEDSVLDDVGAWLLSQGFVLESEKEYTQCWIAPDGGRVLQLQRRAKHHRISASGSVVRCLREFGEWLPFLGLLAECPHRVTRLDVALDVGGDMAAWLRKWRRAHRSGRFVLYRNELDITYFTKTRSDGKESGTVYLGYRTKARFTARVYDKSFEAERRGEALPPTIRYEATIRGGHATLHDAGAPAALFWEVMGSILPPPENPPERLSVDLSPRYPTPPSPLPYQLLKRGIAGDPHLGELIRVAAGMPHGTELLLQLVRERVEAEIAGHTEAA